MIENRRQSLRNFLRSLEDEEREWLACHLLGEFRAGLRPAKICGMACFPGNFGFPDALGMAKAAPFVFPESGSGSSLCCCAMARCGLPKFWRSRRPIWRLAKELSGLAANLRKNRAIELELSGLPYALINLFMGRVSRNSALVTGFEKPWQIIKNHIREEHIVKTSARNVFQGKVSKIRKHGILAEITVETASGLNVVSMITEASREKMALAEGKLVNALVKAPFVSVVAADDRAAAAASADNCFRGAVEEARSDNLAEEILVRLPQGNLICALYAMGARPDSGVAKGREVLVCFSSFSVILTEE